MMKFLNPQSIITVLACIGVFFITRSIVKFSSKREINRLEKTISILKVKASKDSLQIANCEHNVFDLTQTVDATKNNTQEFQSVIAQLKKERDSFKSEYLKSEQYIKCMEESGNMRYFVKGCLSSWYVEQKEKPTKIKPIN
jgi:peptidoglycan hydrolase CwlO-like protein